MLYTCYWHNATKNNINNDGEVAILPRNPLGELCERLTTATTTVTSIPHNNSALTIGLSTGLGVAGLLAIVSLIWVGRLKSWWCAPH
jgi:hypothetical protein